MNRQRCPRGLAVLELVLALPILLMIMALMVNVGVVGAWKVRALNLARHEAWQTRWPRDQSVVGSHAGPPRSYYNDYQGWPETAGMNAGKAGSVPELDQRMPEDRVARGPLPEATINQDPTDHLDWLDPSRGLRHGWADITRTYAMLAKMGNYNLHAETWLLDDKWQFQRMGSLQQNQWVWMGSTYQRRIPILYTLAQAPPMLSDAYRQAVIAILQAPFRQDLAPLDKDDEFIGYNALFGWGGGAPNFYPGLTRFCSLDQQEADLQVKNLIDRIQGKKNPPPGGVPKTMTSSFIRLYKRVIQELQKLPGTEAEVGRLQKNIDKLNQFLQTL